MIVTLNQKEIESMLIDGLKGMGILHDSNVSVTLVAGRSPAGMTAEVKFEPREIVIVTDNRESFSGNREHPAPQAAVEEEGNTKITDKASTDEELVKSVQPNAPLFGKSDKA